MNKAELIDAMAAATDDTKANAAKHLAAFQDIVTNALKKGDSVTLVGWGAFAVGKRAARTGRNPKTGEAIKIPATKTPKFSAGATLKKEVNS